MNNTGISLLTYCTNIHAGESWDEHFASLKANFPGIKAGFSGATSMGIGLRLSNQASIDLMKPAALAVFKEWLAENDAFVFTMNGFPYGNFHQVKVKALVHHPDWTTAERTSYTLRLFDILSELLPDGIDGGVSTSPLGYKYSFGEDNDVTEARNLATQHIVQVAERLIALRQHKGQLMHLDIEPEPDGVLENGYEFIEWYEQELLPAGVTHLTKKLALTVADADKLLREHITLCYDVCHFAVGYENHAEIIQRLANKNIKVGKIQISAALKVLLPQTTAARNAVANALVNYNEDVYLHQVVARNTNGHLTRYRDLPDALAGFNESNEQEWRIHFHIPLFTNELDTVQSTNDDVRTVLEIQKQQPFTQHLEVETYTWEVLPLAMKLPIDQSILRELLWVKVLMS